MGKTFAYTNGDCIIAPKLSTAVDLTLTAGNKNGGYVCVEATAASKSVILGLDDGEVLWIVNTGATNAFTAKNLSTDTGVSVAAGKVAIAIGSTTANGTKIIVVNAGGGT